MSRLIAFWSPSGAGATTLLLSTATAMSARQAHLAAADFNLTTPGLALAADLLPHDRPQSVCLSRHFAALEAGLLTLQALTGSLLPAPGFALLPGVLDVVAGSHMTDEHVRRITRLLTGQYDHVLADLTPALDSVACLPLLELADRVVLVVGPEIGSRFHTRRFLLPAVAMGLTDKFIAVLNRAGAVPVAQVAQDIGVPVQVTVPDVRILPDMMEAGQIPYLSQSVNPALGRFRAAVDGLATLLMMGDKVGGAAAPLR
ncbi:MAG TPA: hypothetical protein VD969_10740 [Symbiobacteriaceae bacterium]|nr:hypothetical protein [Symbiobacteriaceae bacterium]